MVLPHISIGRKSLILASGASLATVIVLLFSGLPLQAGTSGRAELVVDLDFEDSDLDALKCHGNCPTIVRSEHTNGRQALGFALTPDMPTNYRTEAIFKHRVGHFDLGQEYWIGMDYYFKDWANDSNRESVPLQVHSSPSEWTDQCRLGSAYSTAPFFVSTADSQLRFVTYGGKTLWEGPIDQHQWSRITINFRPSYQSDGFVEAWIDGQRLGRVDGANQPRTDKCGGAMRAPYFNMGVYKWDWKRKVTESTRREVHVDNLRIAKGSDGFDIVSPNGENPPQPSPTSTSTATTATTVPSTVVEPPTTTEPRETGSLVAHYDFENIAAGAVKDISGNGHDGVSYGPSVGAGKTGSALQFDGTADYVDVGVVDIHGPGLTLSAWIKADDFGVHDARIVSKSVGVDEQQHHWMLSTIEQEGSKLRFRLKTDGHRTTTLIGDKELPLGRWVLATATYDGKRMRLFLNGDESGSVRKTGTVASDDSMDVHIGDNPVSGARAFDGAIDDLRIYSRALSLDEIADLVDNLPPSPPTSTTTTSTATTSPPAPTTVAPTTTIAPTTSVAPTTTSAPTAPPSREHLIFEDGFESGYDKWRKVPAIAKLTGSSREGNSALRISADPSQKRSELVPNGTSYEWNKEYWVGFSINVPVTPTGYRIISQHHSTPSTDPTTGKRNWGKCTSGPNSFTVKVVDGELEVRTTTIASNVNVTPPIGSASWGTKAVTAPFELNKWHDFVLHFRYAPDRTGFMEVWVDGKKIVDVKNSPTVYNKDLCGLQRTGKQYQKIGIYHGHADPGGEVIYDAFRVGNGNANYGDVAPR